MRYFTANFCLPGFGAGKQEEHKGFNTCHSLVSSWNRFVLHGQHKPVKCLLFRRSRGICSVPRRWGLCSTDEVNNAMSLEKNYFNDGLSAGCHAVFAFNYAPWWKTHPCLFLHCYKVKGNDTRLEWRGKVRDSAVQVSFMVVLYVFHLMCGRCAVVVKWLAVDLAVMCWAQGVLKTLDTCRSVCALAIGTSTHSDRHLPSSSNPFHTSSPDDKSYFPYRHSEKELGGKQLKAR